MQPARSALWILCAVLLVLASACSDGGNGMLDASGGRVQIVLSSSSLPAGVGDASGVTVSSSPGATPGALQPSHDGDGDDELQRLTAANVTLSSILARDLEGRLIDVTIALPTTIDLLSLGGGGEAMLPVGFLPPGTYDQIVIVMTRVNLELSNGTRIEITPPGGGWTAIIPVVPFTVIEGQTTTIQIRFHPERSFAFLNGHFEFDPEFEHEHGDHDDEHDG